MPTKEEMDVMGIEEDEHEEDRIVVRLCSTAHLNAWTHHSVCKI